MKFLMYGAGSIGRGFIGPLFSQAGYEVVFVDVNLKIIDALNDRCGYRYTIATAPPYDLEVTNVRGVNGQNEQAVMEEIASCDLMATSLGAAVLKKVAPIIAGGFSLRMNRSGQPLNLLICENLKDASYLLRGWMESVLPEKSKQLLIEKCGLIETAIGRMVPVAILNTDDPLHVTVEEYGFLPVDSSAFIGKPPDVENMVLYSPFSFYEERKLYLHNMGHAICAYLGMNRGFKKINEAISDPVIRLLVQSAMTEAATMLSLKYEIPFVQIFDHAEDLLFRFSNAELGDTCERVGNDPMRKLSAGDRLAGALCQCSEYGVPPVYITLGYASALRYITNNAEQAVEIAINTGKLPKDLTELVMKMFTIFNSPIPELLKVVGEIKKDLRGNIV